MVVFPSKINSFNKLKINFLKILNQPLVSTFSLQSVYLIKFQINLEMNNNFSIKISDKAILVNPIKHI